MLISINIIYYKNPHQWSLTGEFWRKRCMRQLGHLRHKISSWKRLHDESTQAY